MRYLAFIAMLAACSSPTAPKSTANACTAVETQALNQYGPPIGEGTDGPDTLTMRYAHFTLYFNWSSGTCQENETSP